MQIGIIFYSFSGHTLSVIKKIKEKLTTSGHEVIIEQLETAAPLKLTTQTVALKSIPNVESYDALVIASPVHGGRISSPVASFLEKAPSLQGKKIVCLATHFLPYGWGGKQMIQLMEEVCKAKGAQIIGVGNVPRLSLMQDKYIDAVAKHLSKLI
ncbi:MAG TPA: flavodoxin [Anaerolineae bacterium]|nr:flavodoxin [Anaerolineae bacterium]